MLRLLSRFIGTWLVAAALVAAVVDGAKSIAASALVVTPLSQTLATISAAGAAGEPAAAPAVGPVWSWVLEAPTAALLAALGFLFLAAGRKRRGRLLGPEIAT